MMRLFALFAMSALVQAPAQTAPQTTTLTPAPTQAEVYFKSPHDPCIITGSTLTEGRYTVTFTVTVGKHDNPVTTDAFAHYEMSGGAMVNHVFVDWNLEKSAPCPVLTFSK